MASRKTDPKQTDNIFILKVKHICEIKCFRYSYLLPNCCSGFGPARAHGPADLMTAEVAVLLPLLTPLLHFARPISLMCCCSSLMASNPLPLSCGLNSEFDIGTGRVLLPPSICINGAVAKLFYLMTNLRL